MSLIDERGQRRVRMAYLSVLASHKINGVSALHSNLMVETIFADFARVFPERFCNQTNGITPRRWLSQANRPLSSLIDSRIGTTWRRHLGELGQLRELADEPEFNNAFRLAKMQNKRRLAERIARETGVVVNPEIACSTCRSSACTNTSASCLTCCTSSPATTRFWPGRTPTGCRAP